MLTFFARAKYLVWRETKKSRRKRNESFGFDLFNLLHLTFVLKVHKYIDQVLKNPHFQACSGFTGTKKSS